MAITNYTELTGAVVAWLDVPTADVSSVISNLVLAGEKRIMREVRVPTMETSFSAAMTAGLIAVPANYVEMKFAYVDGSPTQFLKMMPPSYIYERYPSRSAEAKPHFIARDGANFIFGAYPDSDYTVKGTYYKHLTAVQTSANGLFTASPDLYLWGCLAESEPILGRDRRIQIWESKYQLVKSLVNGEADRSRFGGNLQIRPL